MLSQTQRAHLSGLEELAVAVILQAYTDAVKIHDKRLKSKRLKREARQESCDARFFINSKNKKFIFWCSALDLDPIYVSEKLNRVIHKTDKTKKIVFIKKSRGISLKHVLT